jgi:tetratricopeptide (TPR) repeat protein
MQIAEKLDEKGNLVTGLIAVASVAYLPLGELVLAEQNLQRSIKLSREIQDKYQEAVGHGELGRLLAYCGVFDEASKESEISTRYWTQTNNNQGVYLVESYRALRELLLGDARSALEAARQARMLVDEFAKTYFPLERDIIRAEWLLGTALIMEGKDLNDAAAHLTDALTRCRRINMVDHEPNILLAWARWHHARENTQEAQSYAEQALTIADRCEYRLAQAEIHNFLARLTLDAGDSAMARQHAKTARERAWCDGPPHCYKPALDEAEGMLKELDVRE